jgi:hypothetical protein
MTKNSRCGSRTGRRSASSTPWGSWCRTCASVPWTPGIRPFSSRWHGSRSTRQRHTHVAAGIHAESGPHKDRRSSKNRIGKPSQSLLPDRFIFREQPGTRGNIRENAEARGRLFSPVPVRSWHAGTQKDRRKGVAVRSAVIDAPLDAQSRRGFCQQQTVSRTPRKESSKAQRDSAPVAPRRRGFDAIGIVLVDCRNDGSPITVHAGPPAPGPTDDFHNDQMVRRPRGASSPWPLGPR